MKQYIKALTRVDGHLDHDDHLDNDDHLDHDAHCRVNLSELEVGGYLTICTCSATSIALES